MNGGQNAKAVRYGSALAVVVLSLWIGAAQVVSAATWEVSFLRDAATPKVRCVVAFDAQELSFEQRAGFDFVVLEDGSWLNEPGCPMLPKLTARVALPGGMAVTGLRVAEAQTVELPGQYNIFPAQPYRRLSEPPGAWVNPDPRVYTSKQEYPGRLAEFDHQADLAGQAFAVVTLYPLQYRPAEGRLVLCTYLVFELDGLEGYVCGDYLPPGASPAARRMYERMVTEMVVNAQQVRLEEKAEMPAGVRGVGPGRYDMVIITDPAWVSNFQPLADWKTKKGVPTAIVTTEWIYTSGGYAGSSEAKIRAFVEDARNNWGAIYFLLGGDTNLVPYGVRSFLGDDIPNDTYFADYDNDWICEVHVGRASVRTTTHISRFVNKVLTYEKNPPLTNYATCAMFCGFDLQGAGSGEGEQLKQAIYGLYLPSSWTYRYEYDSEPGNHKTAVIGYLNQGNNLVNHADHSNTTTMGVGSVNHDWSLSTTDMGSLTNGSRQSILYSLGCYACDYANETTCIAESFFRNGNGGGLAFIGNSRYGWYVPGSSDGVSARYDRYFFRSLFIQNHYILGECFSDHKNDAWQNDDYMKYIFTELTLLGDPELPIWTQNPATLTVSHADSLVENLFTDFPVTVTSGGNPVAGARVCLFKPGDVYEVSYTDSSGTAHFWFAPRSTGTMYVTVTAHNYLPRETQADVSSGTGPYVLTVLVEGAGTVVVDPPSGPYPAGTPVQLYAQPAEDWCFDHWEGSVGGSNNPTTLVMNGNKIVTAVFRPDCNHNGIADERDLAQGTSQDCNANGVPDECDIASGYSPDCQPNGVPDECDLAPPAYVEARDACAEALIVCPPNVYYGSTAGATNDGSASCGSSAAAPDVWYYYRPYGSGLLDIRLSGSAYDTVVSVHTGCPGTLANEVGCNDDYYGSQSRLLVAVQHGQHYWIRISGAAGAAGDFVMSVSGPACYYTGGDENANGIPDECENCTGQLRGDANCDGLVNAFDIDAFVLALTDAGAWQAQYAGSSCRLLCVCDCNGDGQVNAFDVDPFVYLLSGR